MQSPTETMRAVVLTGHGGLDRLEYREDMPKPVAGPCQLVIKIAACGLNNTDVNTRTAWYSKAVREATTDSIHGDDDDAAWGGRAIAFPHIQGADIAGYVEQVGEGADPAFKGKRVLVDPWLRDWDNPYQKDKMGYVGSECHGGFAEYIAIDYRQVHMVTSDLSDRELATFPTAYITAENMLTRAQVGAGDSVLIPGASGGVGSALIQLAHRRGAKTIAIAARAKIDQLAALAPTAIIAREDPDPAAALVREAGLERVSVLADVVGGESWSGWLELLAQGGRFTSAGAIAGPIVQFDLRTFYLNDLTFTGATTTPPDLFANLAGYIERGEIRPLLAGAFPLEDLAHAQSAFLAKRHVGNFVVTP
ncbi:MAG: alcohol dehydrogenase family protein [Pseudomonadota bacterium]